MNMLSAKWVERDGETIALSPADECVSFLSHPSRVNGIKSKSMRAKHDIKALVSCNNYASYTMGDVPPILDYKLVLPMGKFNGLRVHYNIRTETVEGTEVNPFCPQHVQGAHFPHCAHGQGWCGRHDRQGGRWQLPVC